MTLAFVALLGLQAQPNRSVIEQRLREEDLSLVDLRNNRYDVAFPKERVDRVQYNPDSDYIASLIVPGGRSLFAQKRVFRESPQYLVEDFLIRRSLEGFQVGPEETIENPFINFFQFAVSEDEKFMVVAGRLRGAPKATRDGIFLFKRGERSALYIAPYESLNEKIRSLNVSNGGNLVIYEDDGTVMKFELSNGYFALTDHHPGQLPALVPNGHRYIYANDGELLLSDGSVKHRLLPASNIVGAIRVSPNGEFVAFGEDPAGNLGETRLTVCHVQSKTCLVARKYSARIAGRETFWRRR
jgi:hypothetical protein